MNLASILAGGLVVVGSIAAIYGLHHLALRLEDRGYIYYLRKQPKGGGAAGGFVAMQRIIEPQAEHIFVIHEHSAHTENEEGAGPLGPNPPDHST